MVEGVGWVRIARKVGCEEREERRERRGGGRKGYRVCGLLMCVVVDCGGYVVVAQVLVSLRVDVWCVCFGVCCCCVVVMLLECNL